MVTTHNYCRARYYLLALAGGRGFIWQYQPNKPSNSWSYTITEHNIRINQAFKDSPSLKRYFAEIFEDCYQDARKLTAKETGLNIKIFPLDCPFSQEDVLNSDRLTEE